MNNIDDIYKEFGSNFCLRPFIGAFYSTQSEIKTGQTPANLLKPCCVFDPEKKYKVVDQTLIESLNNPEWIELRKQFVQGNFHQIKNCSACIDAEVQGGASPRLGFTQMAAEHNTSNLIAEIKAIIDNNFLVTKILDLDYFPSNYCDYSCIMCDSAASSQRATFEIKVLGQPQRQRVINSTDQDFFDLLRTAEVINFTGGETLLQKQVLQVIDFLIQEDLAKNVTIFLLTNGSSFPDELDAKFRKFRCVIYMVSVDGTGAIAEYQRRNSNWPTVQQNALKLIHHDFISTVVNYVLTAVNALDFMSFADWVYDNSVEFISLSNVYQPHLSVGVFPQELKELCLTRLDAGIKKYSTGTSKEHRDTVRYIQQAKTMIENTVPCTELLPEFINHIRKEDSVSKRTLTEVVPEWAPYFKVDH